MKAMLTCGCSGGCAKAVAMGMFVFAELRTGAADVRVAMKETKPSRRPSKVVSEATTSARGEDTVTSIVVQKASVKCAK